MLIYIQLCKETLFPGWICVVNDAFPSFQFERWYIINENCLAKT